MSVMIAQGPAILIGYCYQLALESEAALFPEGAEFLAEIRSARSSQDVIVTLSSSEGAFVRGTDHVLWLSIPADATARMQVGTIIFDIARVDTAPHLPLGFSLEIPVLLPVTRGLL